MTRGAQALRQWAVIGVACAVWSPLGLAAAQLPPVRTVFLIVMENQDWPMVKGNPSAPFINNALLPVAAACEQYFNPPGLHPSLPNYLWLEAGTNFGIYDDYDPAFDHQSCTNHLSTLLNNAGISWRAYQEDISGTYVPLSGTNNYAVRHNPFVYFEDVTGTNDPACPYGIAHIRPYCELAADLSNNTVASYNFITPNSCHDMHDACAPAYNPLQQGDDWLANEVPKILNSQAYQNGGLLIITWDEGATGDGPIGFLLLSPLARGGYCSRAHYTHSSLLRTVQEIFGVTPLLGDAANAADLSELFFGQPELCNVIKQPGGAFQAMAAGLLQGRTNVVQASSDLVHWADICTNALGTNRFTFTDDAAAGMTSRFYRVLQLP